MAPPLQLIVLLQTYYLCMIYANIPDLMRDLFLSVCLRRKNLQSQLLCTSLQIAASLHPYTSIVATQLQTQVIPLQQPHFSLHQNHYLLRRILTLVHLKHHLLLSERSLVSTTYSQLSMNGLIFQPFPLVSGVIRSTSHLQTIQN